MNEKVVFRFLENGRPLPVEDLVNVEDDRGGVVLNGETSTWPRGVRFGFEGIGAFKAGLDSLRKQTPNGKHQFKVEVRNGTLSFATVNPKRIPTGSYSYKLRIADLEIENGEGRLQVKEDGAPVEVELNVRPEPRRVRPTDSIHADQLIAGIVNGNSRLDGQRIIDWLGDDAPRPKRKACLLNILAKLSTTPTEEAPLITFVREIFFADVDRIYAKVAPALLDQLRELDDDPRQPFSKDQGPLNAGHFKIRRLFAQKDQGAAQRYVFQSFRQDAQPSLQIVVAIPPDDKPGGGFYADIDIDLGNPKRDLAGFFIHLGELINEGQTDHLKLNKQLKKDMILSRHLHYSIDEVPTG
ncbi:MAG TPA: hypothetical protein VF297_17540 [Pyrinomonadaceae bacterium]